MIATGVAFTPLLMRSPRVFHGQFGVMIFSNLDTLIGGWELEMSSRGVEMPRVVSISAVECSQNGTAFYVTVIKSEILNKVCFVSRRDEDSKSGFQRLLNPTRAKAIASYLESGGVIPSAIIVSAQPSARMQFDHVHHKLSFDIVGKSFLVIDGQHRQFGLMESRRSWDFPVIIFSAQNTQKEVELFIDINTKQKGVPSALLLDIKQLAGRDTKTEEKQRELFDLINGDSVLANKLSSTRSVRGKIARNVFNEATKMIFESGPLSAHPVDTVYKAVRNYLEAAEEAFRQSQTPHASLTKATLFKAIFQIFNDVCTRCLSEFGDLKRESLIKVMEPLSQLPFDAYVGSNRTAIQRIVADMRSALEEEQSFSEDMF